MDEKEIKNIAETFVSIRRALTWAKKNFITVLLITGGGTGTVGTLVYSWYSYNVEPALKKFVRNETRAYVVDSMGVFIDDHMKEKGLGFRGGLSEFTGIPRDCLITNLGTIMLEESMMNQKIEDLDQKLYTIKGITTLLINETFVDSVNRGVKLKIAPSGDEYYIDSLGIPWGADYKKGIKEWVYYPPYFSNEMTICK